MIRWGAWCVNAPRAPSVIIYIYYIYMWSEKWTFTSWKKPVINEKLIVYMIWQKEICPNMKLTHYQGYVEFKRNYSLGNIKTIFKDKTIHAEVARHSRATNRLYCTKNESYAGERYECGDIDTGITVDDIFET